MPRSIFPATMLVAVSILLAACNPQASATSLPSSPPLVAASEATAAPTEEPTAEPTAEPTVEATALPAQTAEPTIAEGVEVAGVAVGGLTADAAREKLTNALTNAPTLLVVAAGNITATLEPTQIALLPDYAALVTKAQASTAGSKLPLALTYNQAKLRVALEALAEQLNGPGSGIEVLRDTKAVSASFALRRLPRLDIAKSLTTLATYYQQPTATNAITLPLTTGEAGNSRPTAEQLQAEIKALTKDFKGVVGVYIHDIKSDSEIASLNKGTAFSTASTIKVAILLNAYLHIKTFDSSTQTAIQKMIIDSDNLKANEVLAASVGGLDTEDAFKGADLMSKTMADLGLPTTYQYTPFESSDFIKLYKTKYQVGPLQAGDPPFTNSNRVQRTTPYELAQIYRLIEQCGRGEGKLIEQFSDMVNAARCTEMFTLLTKNADDNRLKSGLPANTVVAHKSGWAQPEVQGDAGIVRSPGGDFIISIYIYQPGQKYADSYVQQMIGNFARLVYSYYNPVVVK